MKNVKVFGVILLLIIAGAITGADALDIQDVRVSNLMNTSAVVSWTTDEETTVNTVYYDTTKPVTTNSPSANDATVDDVHYVEILGLGSETTYYLYVDSDGVKDDNNGEYYEFTTSPLEETSPYDVAGIAHERDGTTPAKRAIVYATVTHSGVTSTYASALTKKSDGFWTLDLSEAKDPTRNYKSIVLDEGDVAKVEIHGAQDGTNSFNFIIDGSGLQNAGECSLPVELSFFLAMSSDEGIKLKWETESEINNLGWNVYRSEKKNGEYVKINGALIEGAGTSATPHTYEYIDENAEEEKRYYYYIENIDFEGNRERSDIIEAIIGSKMTMSLIPDETALLHNYPNPFNPETWIPFKLVNDSNVKIKIYSVHGHLVKELDLGYCKSGFYFNKDQAAYWDGRDSLGEKVTSGIYFYHLEADNFKAVRKMVVLK